jgi:hypothetical protein
MTGESGKIFISVMTKRIYSSRADGLIRYRENGTYTNGIGGKMKSVFEKMEYRPQTFFQKLFKIQPKENSIIELNNMLAEKGPDNISIKDIEYIASKYRVNLYKTYPNQLLSYYKSYLVQCLADKQLSADEVKTLDNLKFIFNLKYNDTKEILDGATKAVYQQEVNKVIQDGVLSKEEEGFLLELERNLHMPHDLAMSVYGSEARDLFSRVLTNAISDERLSPEEERQIQTLAADLRVTIDCENETRALLDKYKLLWQIDNGFLPEIKCDINLQKNEICHFSRNYVNWFEQRVVTHRIGYSGLSYRVSICKGLSWRAGNVSPQIISDDVWKIIDTGDLYLTNKRIIFMGSKGNKTITFKKVLDFTVYTNGITIQKDAGKSPFLGFDYVSDIFGMILGKLLAGETE